MQPGKPSWRKLAAIVAIGLVIALWAGLVAAIAPFVGQWPVIVQAAFYLVAGIAWIFPIKPLIKWAESARWSDHSAGGNAARVIPAPEQKSS